MSVCFKCGSEYTVIRSDILQCALCGSTKRKAVLSDRTPGQKAMTAEEWASLSPESRHRLSVLGMDVERLAQLVCDMFHRREFNSVEMERLALSLVAPRPPQDRTGANAG